MRIGLYAPGRLTAKPPSSWGRQPHFTYDGHAGMEVIFNHLVGSFPVFNGRVGKGIQGRNPAGRWEVVGPMDGGLLIRSPDTARPHLYYWRLFRVIP